MVRTLSVRAVAALAILLAGFALPVTAASAAVRPHAASGAGPTSRPRAASPAAAASARRHQAVRPLLRIKSGPGFGRHRRPGTRSSAHVPAASTAAVRAGRAAAVRRVLSTTAVPDTCSGAIQPDTVYPCTTPSSSGTDTFTFSLASSTDLLLLRIIGSSGSVLSFTVLAPDDSTVACQQPTSNELPQCPTTQAGTYTLQVQNGGGSYTLAYQALLSDTSCTAADPSFATPALTASLTAGEVGTCYTLAMTAGQILHVNSTWEQQDLLVTVYDSTGALVCADDQGDCPLTGAGPYRVEADAISADAFTYVLELNNIVEPQGCLAGPQLTYGSTPDTSSADRCRTLTVTTAGLYQVYAVSPQQGLVTSTLYQPDGTVACTNTYSSTGPACQLAAGPYDLVADPFAGSAAQVGAVFIAADESRGCHVTGDSDFASGPAIGTFTGYGEEICLTLPSGTGPAVYLFDQPAPGLYSPQIEVVDATGAQVCQDNGDVFTNCALTGTAPFRIVLSGQSANGDYRVLAQASDSAKGCKPWPRSGFGGSWGATERLTAVADAACLSIPAKQHSTGEMIDYSDIKNVVDAGVFVYDPTGKNVCTGASSALCPYRSGVTYTALLVSSTGKPDTYHLVRRDVSRTARCSAPKSTVPGGPATTLELTSDLDSHCLRVKAAAGDKLSFEIRSEAPNSAGALLQVTNASGGAVCFQDGGFCDATGSTSYQVIITALGYQGIAITAHVDTWLVGSASAWAPACRAHQLSGATGWAPIRVHLSEAAAGYCAVLTVKAGQETTIYNPNTTGTGVDQPFMTVQSAAGWSTGQPVCSGGASYVACEVSSFAASGQYALLVYPFELPLPASYSFQGVCTSGCPAPPTAPVITSVRPASGPSGSVSKLVVGGTNLNLGVQVELASDANNVASAAPVSLGAGGKSLTVLLNTQGVAPGLYDVVQFGVGYTVGTPSPGYLPGAYRVTGAPPAPPVGTFVPDGPRQILNTRTSLGGHKGAVLPHRAAVVKVAGVAGVPARGVSAVLLNVTAEDPASSGTLIAYSDRAARPEVTDLSFSRGQSSSGQIVVPVRDGRIDLYNNSAGRTGLAAVLSGYFTTTGTHGLLTTVKPARILDTRTGLGARKARLGARRTLRLAVGGAGGVPRSGVSAVELSVTVGRPARTGALTLFADGTGRPAASQLAFATGQTTTALIMVPLRNGKVDLYNGSSGPVDLTADVTGYVSGHGARFQAAGPVRVLNTATGLGGADVNVLAHAAADLSLGNLPDWQGSQQDVVLSVTVFDAKAGGSLSVFPDGSGLPPDANLVFSAGKPVTIEVIVGLSGPSIDFYNDSRGTVQVAADLQGYGLP
jgi:hypothetical protein